MQILESMQTDRPGTHALVVGVSAYRHVAGQPEETPAGRDSRLEPLQSAARTSAAFAAWLLQDYDNPGLPLSSLHLLLSPAPGERLTPAIAELLDGDVSATLDNFKADLRSFRDAADSHRENVAIVYVAGHGVQLSKAGAILLLEDFAAPTHNAELEGAIDVAGLHEGMNHDATAATQFWFVDVCRQEPANAYRFDQMRGAYTISTRPGHCDVSPIYLAASTGSQAYGRQDGESLFFEGLKWALEKGALVGPSEAVDRWHVSVSSLNDSLKARVAELAEEAGVEQSVDPTGRMGRAVFSTLANVPLARLHVTITPDDAARVTRASLLYDGRKPAVVADNREWPLQKEVVAGLYSLNYTAQHPFRSDTTLLNVRPPETRRSVEVAS